MKRPTIQIIGSTRFKKEMEELAWELTRKGYLVWLPNFKPDRSTDIDESLLEDIGFCKLQIVDEVFVFNKDNYIGSSTKKEIDLCKKINKKMTYLFNA